MSFLDEIGLSYLYSKLKEKFIRSVNSITPDAFGDVKITNVATADNLTSPDNQTSYDKYIYRTSGGDASLTSGPAELMYIEGNMNIVGRQEEILNAVATNNITVTINAPVWRQSAYGEESGTYTFNYTASTETWSPSLGTYGLSVSNVNSSNVQISAPSNIEATITKTIWETQITTTGTYEFTYTNETWTLNGSTVSLSTYGISITGTPEDNDIILVDYIAATPDSTITVTYQKLNLGTIYVPTPTAFSATGFNQCDTSTMKLDDMTISNGYITSATGKYVCYCKAVGGVTNGYVAYSENGYIENIGWCASEPQESSEVITTGQNVTSTLASITFNDDGYVVVVVNNISDLCIHPKWSGAADEQYEEYVEPSIITFPTTGTLNSTTVQLPLATYGMPAIGAIADKMDLESHLYIQKIGHYIYSAANLQTVQSLGVEYEYDLSHIYYVLPTPIQYNISINSSYTVNDWGTEEFIGTIVEVGAQTLYAQNLRDKLRTDVLTISPQDLTVGQQGQVYTNLNLKSYHLTDTISAFPKTINDSHINYMTSVANIVFGTPSAVLSDVGWTTASGSVVFTGTLASDMTTTVDFDIAPILSVAAAEVNTATIEAEVNAFLNNLQEDIDDTQAQASVILSSINDELQALQSDAAVELKKLQFNNVTLASSAFASNSTYEDYEYRGTLALNNVIANMVPEVTLSVKDATAGTFAPVAETYNGGIYLYSNEMPEEDLTIPTIICWRGNG